MAAWQPLCVTLCRRKTISAADASAGFTKMLAGISGVTEKLGLGVDQAGDFQQALANISAMDTFNGQARAMASLAAHLLDASGGLENMNAEARAAYQALLDAARSAADVASNASAASSNIGGAAGEAARLAQNLSAAASALAGVISATANLNVGAIGLEAQNRALESGNTLIQARTAGLVAAKKAELASALGSGDGVIRAAATAELNNYTAAVERSSSAQEVNERLTKAMTASLGGGGGGGGGGLSKATKDATKELDKMADEIERLEFDADPVKKYNAELARLDELLVGNGTSKLTDGAYEKAVKDLNEEFANSDPLISGIGDAIGDFVAGGMRNFGDLLDSFKNMIKQMIATAIANPIKLALTTAFSGGGTAAAGQVAGAPAGGAMGGAGNLLGLGGIGASFASGASGLLTAFGGGGGFAAAGTYLSAVTTGATASIGAFAAAAGAVALPLLAVAAVFSFFKSKTKELDAGLRFTVDGMDTLVQSFQTLEKKKFWGLSKKVRTSFSDLSERDAQPLIAATDAVQGSVVAAAAQLGFAADAFDGFTHDFSISLKGLDEAAKQQAVADALEGLGDEMAAMILGVGTEVKEAAVRVLGIPLGEITTFDNSGMFEELTALANSLVLLNQTFDTLGRDTLELSLTSGRAAAEIADLAGGLDNLTAISNAYYQGFYSDAERFTTAHRQIAEQFAALNVAMPASRTQFRAMVEAVDVTTESGRAMYVSLLSLAGALDAVLPSVASFTAEIAQMAGVISTQIDAMIGDTSTAMQANEQAAALWYRTSQTLRDLIADMRGTASALVSGSQARAFSEMRFQTLLASAIGGDNEAAGDLTAAARTLLDDTKATARTSLEVARAEARVLSDLQLVSGVSDVEGARHDVIAGLLGHQVDLLGNVRDAINSGNPLSPSDIDGLNGQLGALEGAIKAAEMINYAFLKERLNVAVDLVATADIPEPIRDLLANTATGITATIDYIVRAPNLTPDLRWLALTGSSEHISTLKFVAENTIDKDTRWMAVTRVSELDKTINLLTGATLDAETRRIALAGASELSRTVNVALGSNVDATAMQLALRGVGLYNVAVQASLAPSVSDEVRKIVFGDAGIYSASIQASLAADIPTWARNALLRQQGDFALNVNAVLASSVSDAMKVIVLQGNTSALRVVTILGAYGASLTPEQRALLEMQASQITKGIIGNVWFKDMSVEDWRLFHMRNEAYEKNVAGVLWFRDMTADKWDLFRMGNEAVLKTFTGAVDTSRLSTQQLALLNAVTGTANGTVTLGGSFRFDPSGGFSTWFGNTTFTNINAPISDLRTSLADLSAAVAKSAADGAAASDSLAAALVADTKLRSVNAALDGTSFNADATFTSSTGWQGSGAFEASFSDLYELSKALDVSLKWASGAAKGTNKLRTDVESALRQMGAIASDEMLWLSAGNAGSASVNAGWTEWLKTQGVPSFAGGVSNFAGGLARIHDGVGGEIVRLPNGTDVIPHDLSKRMVDRPSDQSGTSEALLRDVLAEIRAIRQQDREIGRSVISETRRSAKVLEKFDIDGLPEARE